MASINVRKETGKLYFDFRYRNIRCREQTELKDTPSNRALMEKTLEKIQAQILLGCFDYEKTFPQSRLLAKFKKVEQAIEPTNETCPLFKIFAKQWFDEMKVAWSKSYIGTVGNIVFNRLIPQFGTKPVNEIKKADLLKFRGQLAEVIQKNGKPLSPSHINRHLKIVRMILNEAAVRFEFTVAFGGIKPLKVPKSDIKPFSLDEIKLILNNVREDFRDYFTVRFFTGMRTGEIDGLKWKYVDFDNRIIQVRETIVMNEVTDTKTIFSNRDIQMSEPVFQALKNMEKRTSQYSYVFVNQVGNPLDHNKVTKRVWYPLLKNLGLDKRNPYQMRHTAATLWLASGEAVEWIANQMGHANTEMLFRVYSRYVPNLTRQDGSEANNLFSKIMKKK